MQAILKTTTMKIKMKELIKRYCRAITVATLSTLVFWAVYGGLSLLANTLLSNDHVQIFMPHLRDLLPPLLLKSVLAALLLTLLSDIWQKVSRKRCPPLSLGASNFILVYALVTMIFEAGVFARLAFLLKASYIGSQLYPFVPLFAAALTSALIGLIQDKKERAATFVAMAIPLQMVVMACLFLVNWEGLIKSQRAMILVATVIGGFPTFWIVRWTMKSLFNWAERRPIVIKSASVLGALLIAWQFALPYAYFIRKAAPKINSGNAPSFGVKAVKLLGGHPALDKTCELFDGALEKEISKGDVLRFAIAVKPEAWKHGGRFHFSITATKDKGDPIPLFNATLNPFLSVTDQSWVQQEIPLERFAGVHVRFNFSSGREIQNGNDPSASAETIWGGVRMGHFRREPNEYNVILVSLDTLRPDHLSFNGYRRPTSPHFDALAKAGVYFGQAISQAPWTTPSHMSVFTGLYPSIHGLMHLSALSQVELRPGNMTLTECLRNNGYLTQAFTGSAAMAANYGFYRGFDEYAETVGRMDIDADVIFNNGIRWLNDHSKDKFFLFLHTYEIHSPFIHTDYLRGLPPSGYVEEKNALYDGDIHYADLFLGRLQDELKRLNLSDQTIVCVFSDHGEDVPNQKHGDTLYDELIRVPLLLACPTKFSARRVDNIQVQLIDILPTIIDLLGIKWEGERIQGTSLAPLLYGKSIPDRYAYSEALAYGPERKSVRFLSQQGKGIGKFILTPYLPPTGVFLPPENPEDAGLPNAKRFAPLLALLKECGGKEFYDLAADPEEKNNLRTPPSSLFLKLYAKMDEFLALVKRAGSHDNAPANVDEGVKERLRSLGYL